MLEDRTVELLAMIVARGFDARPGRGNHANTIVVRSPLRRPAFTRKIKAGPLVTITAPRPGTYLLRFTDPVPAAHTSTP